MQDRFMKLEDVMERADYVFHSVHEVGPIDIRSDFIDVRLIVIDDLTQNIGVQLFIWECPLDIFLSFLGIDNVLSLETARSSISKIKYASLISGDFKGEFYGLRRGLIYEEKVLDSLDAGIVQQMDVFPIKRFKSFKEEKEFRKCGLYNGWEHLKQGKNGSGVDSDIFHIIDFLNSKIPFTYTNSMSCSGSYNDHGHYRKEHNKLGIDESTHQGYITLRVDTTHPKFMGFKKGLEFSGVELNEINPENDFDSKYQSQLDVKTMAIQARVPDSILESSHPLHRTYLTEVWNNVLSFLKRKYP